MTASQIQPVIHVKDSAGVRKRRRRAPAGGAPDDCFTCTKRGVKCDRRRPYCSQCLEVGNECSGYKTQLTWGVGVASRGKLRGLSLPVAKSPPVAREPKKPALRARSHSIASSSSSCSSQWAKQEDLSKSSSSPIDIPMVSQLSSGPATPYLSQGYDYLSMPSSTSSLHHGQHYQNNWITMPFASSDFMVHNNTTPSKFSRYTFPVITEGVPSSLDSGSDADYMSPLGHSYTQEDLGFVSSPHVLYDGYAAPQHSASASPRSPAGLVIDQSRAPLACPGLVYTPSEASSSLGSQIDPFESHLGQRMMRECSNMSEHPMMPVSAYSF